LKTQKTIKLIPVPLPAQGASTLMQSAPEAPPSSAGFELLISRIDQMILLKMKMMQLFMSQITGS